MSAASMSSAATALQSAEAAADAGRPTLEPQGRALLFTEARTHKKWLDTPVPDALLRALYDLCKMGPTSMNCQPMRVVFVKTPDAKEKLKPALMEGNVDKTMAAPVTAIIAFDEAFHEHLPQLFPHMENAKKMFENKPDFARETAFRNGTLQGGYFIIAARALGLDCGPMSGFDNGTVDEAFFSGTTVKSNFLCNLGYGDGSVLHERSPRPEFEEFCSIV